MSGLPRIALVDFGCGLNPADLDALARALGMQVNTQLSAPPPFGYGVQVASVKVRAPGPDEWLLGFFPDPDQPGALGYHDRTPTGRPIMKCFPLLDSADNAPWQVTASHELIETLVDPELSLCAQGPDGRIWAYEACDAVEQDVYTVAGVPLSNWCTPAWFAPPAEKVPYDFMGRCQSAFEVRPGGYSQTWDGTSWTQHTTDRTRAYRLHCDGRGSRRMDRVRSGR